MADDPIELGWKLLEDGKVDEARKLADRAVTTDADSPEAHTLVGAVAGAEGDVEAALEAFDKAMELDPEYLDPILLAAETHALEGDAKEALRLCERALDVAEEEDEYVDALLIKAEIELGDGDIEAAEKTLGELPSRWRCRRRRSSCAPATPSWRSRTTTARWASTSARPRVSRTAPIPLYGLGLVAEARGEAEAMVSHFQRVRALDEKASAMPWAVTEDRMEELVEAALAELPERAQKLLENVPVMIEPLPSEEVVGDGFDPRGLGLFAGVPFPEQSALSGPPHLEAVFLYQRNIERVARSTAEVEAEIRTTLLHETGHFFGLDEDDLAELGLD